MQAHTGIISRFVCGFHTPVMTFWQEATRALNPQHRVSPYTANDSAHARPGAAHAASTTRRLLRFSLGGPAGDGRPSVPRQARAHFLSRSRSRTPQHGGGDGRHPLAARQQTPGGDQGGHARGRKLRAVRAGAECRDAGGPGSLVRSPSPSPEFTLPRTSFDYPRNRNNHGSGYLGTPRPACVPCRTHSKHGHAVCGPRRDYTPHKPHQT